MDIIKVQIGQQHVKSYFEDESDRLRRTADEVCASCPHSPFVKAQFVSGIRCSTEIRAATATDCCASRMVVRHAWSCKHVFDHMSGRIPSCFPPAFSSSAGSGPRFR